MNDRKTLFVDVVLPVALSKAFTYRVTFEMNAFIHPFVRVVVPFGKGKLVTGLVVKVHEEVPTLYQAKYIEHVLDDYPIVTKKQYMAWEWMSNYYLAPIGDVLNAALPANFKLASETQIVLHPDFTKENRTFSDREWLVIDALEIQDTLNLKELSEIVGIKTIQPLIKQMIERQIVSTQEEIADKYTPKTALFIRLTEQYWDETALQQLFESMQQNKRMEKQEKALMVYLQHQQAAGFSTPVQRKVLEDAGCSISAIQTMEKNGIFESARLVISRLEDKDASANQLPTLSDAQEEARSSILQQFEQKDAVLLHGITGSGKTEIYIQLIQNQLDLGKQVLFLVPEIALTTQLITRLQRYFGQQVGIYHSKFNPNERVEIWNHVLNNDQHKFRVVVGARSSIFLPFTDLGLIIVDEEHESSFKQNDPSPRYNGRDMALVLGKIFQAKVLLGSATPSIEMFQNARVGKIGYVPLLKRYSNVQLPEIQIADMKKERIEKTANGHFSSFLLEEVKQALERNEQVILFQNRRGYTPIWTCEICMYSPECVNCDTTLNYHKHSNILKCHHCSYQIPPIGTCPNCGSNRLKMLGFGTEKIEDDLSLLLPEVKVARMDLDTTRSKTGYQQLISDFEQGKIDVLIGTQMIAKGLDFDRVGLVGILDADLLLHKVDFRAFERSFQLMTQVAGRAGRREKRGKVIVQTSNPDHWVIQKVMQHNYDEFAENEIIERRNYHYPPFYKLIKFTLKHKEAEVVSKGADAFASLLRSLFFERVIGPEFPIIPRIQNTYRKEIMLKIEADAPQLKIKERIRELTDQFYSVPLHKSIRLSIDVDPA